MLLRNHFVSLVKDDQTLEVFLALVKLIVLGVDIGHIGFQVLLSLARGHRFLVQLDQNYERVQLLEKGINL
jgi:hypothetical protein